MKNIVLLVVFGFFGLKALAQENRKNFDFIITIDDNIVQVLASPQIVIKSGNEITRKINVSYHPGSLSLSQQDLKSLPQGENVLFLRFTHYKYCEGEQKIKTYEIGMGKNWFDKPFMIIKIYNIDKKQNKKLQPLTGKTYTFDLEYGGGQMIRIRKK